MIATFVPAQIATMSYLDAKENEHVVPHFWSPEWMVTADLVQVGEHDDFEAGTTIVLHEMRGWYAIPSDPSRPCFHFKTLEEAWNAAANDYSWEDMPPLD